MSGGGTGETAFPKVSWRVGVKEVVGKVLGWEALGKAVSVEIKPQIVAEQNALTPGC